MKLVRNTALLLMLAAGSLALPCAAQQEVMPDIYDAAARSSAPAKNPAKNEMKKATVRPVSHKTRAHKAAPKTTTLMLAKAQPKTVAAK